MTKHEVIAAPVDALAKLREPFPANQISKLPKESRKQSDERKNRTQGCMVWECPQCGGAHHKDAVHLDYVGHAAATDRLLDADPRWTWDPVPDPASLGLPVAPGGMWIKLTVDGCSRYGFGSADGKTGGDAIKEIIGDAIRNAGMRFGMALDLWHKGDLHADEADDTPPPKQDDKPVTINATQLKKIQDEVDRTGTSSRALCDNYGVKALADLNASQFAEAIEIVRKRPDKPKPKTDNFGELLDDEIPNFGAN